MNPLPRLTPDKAASAGLEPVVSMAAHNGAEPMNAIAKSQEHVPTLAADSTQLTPMQMAYQLIARGADFASVREMIEFGKKLEADEAEKAFNAAMAAAQAEMRVVAVDATNPQTRSKYASYGQLDKALRPIYAKHGFALSFNDGEIDRPEWVRVLCYVSHTAGYSRTYHKDMPADGKGARGNDVMTKTHAVGAAQSYAMRYLLRMIFNVATGENADTDGNMPGDSITDEQRDELLSLADERGADIAKFCAFFKIDAVAELPAAKFNTAVTMLKSKPVTK